jgi:hypothetical protein
MSIIKKILGVCALFCLSLSNVFAQSSVATSDLSVNLPDYVSIRPITSPVLTVHITDRTGNLYVPIGTQFKVVSNSPDTKKLYLKATVRTESGYESAMFQQNGRVYVAFASLKKIPTSQSLSNCKIGVAPEDSPGIVAYPVTSVNGGKNTKYINGGDKYEIQVGNGTSYINVNMGQQVLYSSFSKNDPKGCYQAILSLTDTDI